MDNSKTGLADLCYRKNTDGPGVAAGSWVRRQMVLSSRWLGLNERGVPGPRYMVDLCFLLRSSYEKNEKNAGREHGGVPGTTVQPRERRAEKSIHRVRRRKGE